MTIQGILRIAKQEGISSIAFPCLGTANLGYPASISAKILLNEVVSFHVQNPSTIQTYHFVMYKDSDFDVFKEEYAKHVRHVLKVTSSLTPSKRGHLKIILAKGDIAEEKSSVVVNSTSVDMQPRNKISSAIHAAAGPQLTTICSSLVDAGVRLRDGRVVATRATGKLKCNKLYHVNMPGKERRVPPNAEEISLLKRIVYDCLQQAEKDGQRSISFPAFCLGVGGYTVSESGDPMLEALREFLETNPDKLEEIRIVILDDNLFTEFYEFFCKFFKDDSPAAHKVTGSRFKLFKKPKKEEGVYVELQAGGVLSQHTKSSLVGTRIKPSHTGSFAFRVFSVSQDTLSLVEEELRGFVDKHFLEDCVDLGECVHILQPEDIEKMKSIAETCGVEIRIQEVLERVLVYGEVSSVVRACTKIHTFVLDLAKMMVGLKMNEWSVIDDSDSTVSKYPSRVSMLLERALSSSQDMLEVELHGVSLEIDLQNMTERNVTSGLTRMIQRDKKIEQPGKEHVSIKVCTMYNNYAPCFNVFCVATDMPVEWSVQPLDHAGKSLTCAFVKVNRHTQEFRDATKNFGKTMTSNFHIVTVQRVQNPQEYCRYLGLKATWQSSGFDCFGVIISRTR